MSFEQIDEGVKKAIDVTLKAIENEQNEDSVNDACDMEIETTIYISEEVQDILMQWSFEEIRHYYSLMWKQSKGNDKAQKPTYVCIQESTTIEGKSWPPESHELLQIMRRRPCS